MTKTALCRKCLRLVETCRCKAVSEEKTIENRESSSKRGYGRKWRQFRQTIWMEAIKSGMSPTCAECKKPIGLESPHFDHIEPVEDANDPRFYDRMNIQFLHHECHARKTARDVRNGKTRTTKKAY